MKCTEAIEDYLRAIYELQRETGLVTTTLLAKRLDVTPASVTKMLKRLAGQKLAIHERYHGATLTEAGEKIALRMVRNHRLVENYLAEKLGLPRDQVHFYADSWEHVLSERLEARIGAVLGYSEANCSLEVGANNENITVQPDTEKDQ
jgi:DtxR family Mn-dependent transcriptional regulator